MGTVVADVLMALPVFYLCAIMGFRQVRPEWIDVARLQGVGRCGIFWRVWFPVAWPWLVAGIAIGFLRAGSLIVLINFYK